MLVFIETKTADPRRAMAIRAGQRRFEISNQIIARANPNFKTNNKNFEKDESNLKQLDYQTLHIALELQLSHILPKSLGDSGNIKIVKIEIKITKNFWQNLLLTNLISFSIEQL